MNYLSQQLSLTLDGMALLVARGTAQSHTIILQIDIYRENHMLKSDVRKVFLHEK